MDEKKENHNTDYRDEKDLQKPDYEKPRLIKLEDELGWSRGGCSGVG